MRERRGYLLKDEEAVSTIIETPNKVEKHFDCELNDPGQKAVAKRDIPTIRRNPDGLYRIKLEPYTIAFGNGWTINTLSKVDVVEELNRLEKKKKKELFEALQEMTELDKIEEIEDEENDD